MIFHNHVDQRLHAEAVYCDGEKEAFVSGCGHWDSPYALTLGPTCTPISSRVQP